MFEIIFVKKIEDNIVDIIIENGENLISEISISVKNNSLTFSKK